MGHTPLANAFLNDKLVREGSFCWYLSICADFLKLKATASQFIFFYSTFVIFYLFIFLLEVSVWFVPEVSHLMADVSTPPL